MEKIRVLLILFLFLIPAAVSVSPVSAQDVDLSNLSQEQIGQLMMFLQQLQQTPTAFPTPTPRPLPDMSQFEGYDNDQLQTLIMLLQQMQRENGQGGSDLTEETPAAPVTSSEGDTETESFSIYENKKLFIEELPNSMFVRREEKSEPSRDEPAATQDVPLYKDVTKDFETIEDPGDSCTWHLVDGKWFYICGSIG